MPSRLYTLTEIKEWLQPASAFFEWLTVMSPHDADLRRQVQRANQWMRQPAHRALQADEELWAELSLWNDANPYGTIAGAEPYYRQWCISITSIHIEIEAYAIADPAIGPPAPQSFWYSTCFTQQPSADGMLYSAYIGDPLTVFLEDALHCHRYHTTTRHRAGIRPQGAATPATSQRPGRSVLRAFSNGGCSLPPLAPKNVHRKNWCQIACRQKKAAAHSSRK